MEFGSLRSQFSGEWLEGIRLTLGLCYPPHTRGTPRSRTRDPWTKSQPARQTPACFYPVKDSGGHFIGRLEKGVGNGAVRLEQPANEASTPPSRSQLCADQMTPWD
jgi:hypothetical protein